MRQINTYIISHITSCCLASMCSVKSPKVSKIKLPMPIKKIIHYGTSSFLDSCGKEHRNVHASSQNGGTNYQFQTVLFCSLAVLDPRVGHTLDVLSPFIPVLSHSDRLFHGESCPCLDVVHPGRAWPSSPSCTWHCSLHYLFLQATPLFPHGVTIVC